MNLQQEIKSSLDSNKNIPVSPYPELPNVLDKFVSNVKNELAENLIGIYLVGSLASGDFDLDSDIDFMVITKTELNDQEVLRLQAMHALIYNLECYPAKHLEGSYMSVELLNDFNEVGRKVIWYVDNGSTVLEQSLHDNKWHVRWVLRERGITLFGPAPKSLLPAIPIKEMFTEATRTLYSMENTYRMEMNKPLNFFNSRFGQSFSVLTVCRILHTLHTGTVQSKFAGAIWAQKTLDPEWSDFIKQTWEEREGVRFCVKIKQRANQDLLQKTLSFIRYGIKISEQFSVN